jgi:diacylglycerol kinase family enzyme
VATLLRNGDLGSIPGFTVAPDQERVEVSADPPVAAEADGESLGMVDGGSVEWAPESLRVIAPQPLP